MDPSRDFCTLCGVPLSFSSRLDKVFFHDELGWDNMEAVH
jgi:hypothetical protein